MISDPELVYYFCIAYQSQALEEQTILAEFNSADSVLQSLAHQCVQQAPPHHLVYSHTYVNKAYTFLIDDPFIYFGIFDWEVPKYDQIQLLGRLKEVVNHLMKRNASVKLTSFCLQGELHPIFHHLMSRSYDFDALYLETSVGYSINTPTPPPPPPVSGFGKGKKFLSVPFLCSSKIGKGQKKRWLGEDDRTESRDALVDSNMTDSLGDHGVVNEAKSREIVCRDGVCLIDGGGRHKARKMWRRHVWIVLTLDLAVCLILFGIWLFVCRGFQCIDG